MSSKNASIEENVMPFYTAEKKGKKEKKNGKEMLIRNKKKTYVSHIFMT